MNKTKDINNNWRKVAATIYKKPIDSKIYGSVDLDITDLETFISKKRKEGIKITSTYIITMAVARALYHDVPELNSYVKRGKIIQRDTISAMVSVLLEGAQMGSVKIDHAHLLNLEEFSEAIKIKIQESRKGDENKTMQSKNLLSAIPWPFRNWVFALYKMVTIDWGISLPFMGLDSDSFGSFVVSNIGSVGLDTGYPALLPSSNVAIVLVMGATRKKPVVINDQVLPRKIMNLSAVLDHRVVDASHGGKLFRAIKYFIKNPQELETKPAI